jgi:hypothetical protein
MCIFGNIAADLGRDSVDFIERSYVRSWFKTDNVKYGSAMITWDERTLMWVVSYYHPSRGLVDSWLLDLYPNAVALWNWVRLKKPTPPIDEADVIGAMNRPVDRRKLPRSVAASLQRWDDTFPVGVTVARRDEYHECMSVTPYNLWLVNPERGTLLLTARWIALNTSTLDMVAEYSLRPIVLGMAAVLPEDITSSELDEMWYRDGSATKWLEPLKKLRAFARSKEGLLIRQAKLDELTIQGMV